MKILKPFLLVMIVTAIISSVTIGSAARAQETLRLGADDLQRMAIVFAPVQAAGGSDGNRVPATVISPPDVSGTLNAMFTGLLQSWHIETGAEVSAGQLLATLRSEELLEAQQMFLDASVALSHADAVLSREQRLFDEGIIAEQRLQASRRDRQLAAIAESGARRRLTSAGVTDGDLTLLQNGSLPLGIYQLRAPGPGTISQRLAAAGAQISDGDALVSMRGDSRLWVSAQVPARISRTLTIGSQLMLANSAATLTLRQIDRQIDTSSQTLGILAEFAAGYDTVFIPGQIVSLILPPVDAGVRVPAEAVVHAGEETTVYVRTTDGAEARVLQLIPSGRHYIAVEGLTAGEHVVVQGASVLKGIQLGLGGTE